jgi:hypothetical protein
MLIGAIDDGSIPEIQIERFSRRWVSLDVAGGRVHLRRL